MPQEAARKKTISGQELAKRLVTARAVPVKEFLPRTALLLPRTTLLLSPDSSV